MSDEKLNAPDGWREVIEEMAADIEGYVRASYTGHPSQQRKLDRDMEVVRRARAMLAAAQPTAEQSSEVAQAPVCDGQACVHCEPEYGCKRPAAPAQTLTQGCAGFQGQPVNTCGVCHGAGCDGDRAGQEQPAPALDDHAAFEDAMVAAGYRVPERGDAFATQYLFQRDQDRFDGFQMARAALQVKANAAPLTPAPAELSDDQIDALLLEQPSESEMFAWGSMVVTIETCRAAVRAALSHRQDDTELLRGGLKKSVLDVVHKWSDTRPEVDDEETWEEWFSTAFDLMANDIGNVFEGQAAARLGEQQP